MPWTKLHCFRAWTNLPRTEPEGCSYCWVGTLGCHSCEPIPSYTGDSANHSLGFGNSCWEEWSCPDAWRDRYLAWGAPKKHGLPRRNIAKCHICWQKRSAHLQVWGPHGSLQAERTASKQQDAQLSISTDVPSQTVHLHGGRPRNHAPTSQFPALIHRQELDWQRWRRSPSSFFRSLQHQSQQKKQNCLPTMFLPTGEHVESFGHCRDYFEHFEPVPPDAGWMESSSFRKLGSLKLFE